MKCANRSTPLEKWGYLESSIEYPAYGQVRASNELKKRGIFISSGGVRNIWLRHNLQTIKLRLKVLEEKVAKENLILTEAQVQALEKAKEEKWLTVR